MLQIKDQYTAHTGQRLASLFLDDLLMGVIEIIPGGYGYRILGKKSVALLDDVARQIIIQRISAAELEASEWRLALANLPMIRPKNDE